MFKVSKLGHKWQKSNMNKYEGMYYSWHQKNPLIDTYAFGTTGFWSPCVSMVDLIPFIEYLFWASTAPGSKNTMISKQRLYSHGALFYKLYKMENMNQFDLTPKADFPSSLLSTSLLFDFSNSSPFLLPSLSPHLLPPLPPQPHFPSLPLSLCLLCFSFHGIYFQGLRIYLKVYLLPVYQYQQGKQYSFPVISPITQ